MINVMDRRREHRSHHLEGGHRHKNQYQVQHENQYRLHKGNQFGHLQRREDGLQSRGVEQGVHGEGHVGRVAAVVVWHLEEIHFCISVFLIMVWHLSQVVLF